MMFQNVLQFGVDTNTLPILTNLVAWIDFSDPAFVSLNPSAGTISEVQDKSGNHNHFTQTSTSDQPSYVFGSKGRRVARFIGTNTSTAVGQFLRSPSVLIGGTTPRTIFFVAQGSTSASGRNRGITTLYTNSSPTNGTRYDITQELALRVQGGSKVWANDSPTSATDFL